MRPNQPNYKPGPVNISSQTKITPSILRMTWDGYPLHHERKHGWGYLAPEKDVKYLEEKLVFILYMSFILFIFYCLCQYINYLARQLLRHNSHLNCLVVSSKWNESSPNCLYIQCICCIHSVFCIANVQRNKYFVSFFLVGWIYFNISSVSSLYIFISIVFPTNNKEWRNE